MIVDLKFNSKPGAAPVAAWLSHEVIGLHKSGYGALLGESLFTGVKVSERLPRLCAVANLNDYSSTANGPP